MGRCHGDGALVPPAMIIRKGTKAMVVAVMSRTETGTPRRQGVIEAVANMAVDERPLPPDNFSRYSSYLVNNARNANGAGSNGVDGFGFQRRGAEHDEFYWTDTLQIDSQASGPNAPSPFSLLSWNILAQKLYESQYKRRRITEVALHSSEQSLNTLSGSPHPHPWPKRLNRIVEILRHANSDIICLQECERDSFVQLASIMSDCGYDAITQEDDRPANAKPVGVRNVSRHTKNRNHLVATFWKRDKFEPISDASIRTRSMTTVLRLKGENESTSPTLAVVNVHLEGNPNKSQERTHQLQHAMSDLARVVQDDQSGIGKLNALVLTGDFNCELQSSASSLYMEMGRLGKQSGLGGVHGEACLVLPDLLLETNEATRILHPIMEWSKPLSEDKIDVKPHPFRRNGMRSAYPKWLGRKDAAQHFTFCSELNKRPVPGLDQCWYSSSSLQRVGLRNMFVDDSGLWERYFFDDDETSIRRDDERMKILTTGLPDPECKYPSDHLPIGAVFNWIHSDECQESCVLDDAEECSEEVRGLKVIDGEGQDMLTVQSRGELDECPIFETPQEELSYLLSKCPFDSPKQRDDVNFILSSVVPSVEHKVRPTPDQMRQLEERRIAKAGVLDYCSSRVRPWLKRIWKASKAAGKVERERIKTGSTMHK